MSTAIPKTEWPKLMSASAYAEARFVDRTAKSIINDIKADRLPGEKQGGCWYVWVNADLSPANEKLQPKLVATVTPNAAVLAKVQSILSRAGAR